MTQGREMDEARERGGGGRGRRRGTVRNRETKPAIDFRNMEIVCRVNADKNMYDRRGSSRSWSSAASKFDRSALSRE